MQKLRNKVQLIGHLGMDPEVKNLNGGRKIAKFSLATNESYKDASGNKVEDTQWHNVVAWGNLANIVETYVKKGHEVAIEGKLVHRSFETQAGEKRYITEIVANEVMMLKKA